MFDFSRISDRKIDYKYTLTRTACFTANKWRFDKNDSTALLLCKTGHSFRESSQIKDKFHLLKAIIIHRVSA